MAVRASRGTILLWALFLGALGVRLATTQAFQGLAAAPDAEANPDQVDYEGFARRLAEGAGYTRESGEPTAARPPGTSFTLYPIYKGLGHSYLLGRLWFALIGAGTVLAVVFFAQGAFGALAGGLAGLWLAVYPGHFYYSMHFLSEPIYGFWLVVTLATARVAMLRKSTPILVLSGLFLGMTVLTRPQALLLPFFCGGLALFSRERLKYLRALAVPSLVMAIVVAPWIARNHSALGKPTLTTIGGYTLWGANNPVTLGDGDLIGSWIPPTSLVDDEHPIEGTEIEREAACTEYALDFLSKHKSDVPRLVAMKLYRLVSPWHLTDNPAVKWSFALAWCITAPLLVAGLFLAWRRDPLTAALLTAPLLTTAATVVIYYGSIRFRDSVAPVLVILAALAASELLRRLGCCRSQ